MGLAEQQLAHYQSYVATVNAAKKAGQTTEQARNTATALVGTSPNSAPSYGSNQPSSIATRVDGSAGLTKLKDDMVATARARRIVNENSAYWQAARDKGYPVIPYSRTGQQQLEDYAKNAPKFESKPEDSWLKKALNALGQSEYNRLQTQPFTKQTADGAAKAAGSSAQNVAASDIYGLGTLLDLYAKNSTQTLTPEEIIGGRAVGKSIDDLLAEKTYDSTAFDGFRNTAAELNQKSEANRQLAEQNLGKFGTDLVSTATQIALDIPGKIIPGGSAVALGLRAFGGSAQRAANEGATLEEQGLYGIASAGVEAFGEMMSGGLSLVYGKGAADNITEKVISKLAKTEAGQNVLRVIFGSGGEAIEEIFSDAIDPILRTVYSDKTVAEEYSSEQLSDWLYDGLIGAIMGAGGKGIELSTSRPASVLASSKTAPTATQPTGGINSQPTTANAAVQAPMELNQQRTQTGAEALANYGKPNPLQGQTSAEMMRVYDVAEATTVNGKFGPVGTRDFMHIALNFGGWRDGGKAELGNIASALGISINDAYTLAGACDVLKQVKFDGKTVTLTPSSGVARNNAIYASKREAQSTQQTDNVPVEYSIPYTEESAADIRRETKNFKNVVAGIDLSVKDFFSKWVSGRKSHLGDKLEKLYLGEISDAARAKLSNLLGYEVTSTDYILSNDGVKHIWDEHGNPEKEIKNGNLPITDNVLESLPEVLANPDSVELGHKEARGNRIGIVFKKNLPDGTVIYIQFDNTGRGTLEGKTLYVKPATTPGVNADKSANTFTPETAGPVAQAFEGTPSTSNIPNPQQNVNSEPTMRERGFSRNIRTDQNMRAELRQSYEADPEMYRQLGNAETLAAAEEIYDTGLEKALGSLETAIRDAKSGKKLDPKYVPLSRLVANELTALGRVDEARAITSDIAAELTWAGQLGQAGRILRNSDPLTMAQMIESMVAKYNSKLTNRQIAKNKNRGYSEDGKITIDEELLNRYAAEADPDKSDALLNEIEQKIADQIPPTAIEMLNAWRYTAMLGNVKTVGRNFVGNTGMGGVVMFKNKVKAVMELAAEAITDGKYERTTSLIVDKELKKQAKADAAEIDAELRGERKYKDGSGVANQRIQDKRKILPGVLETWRVATNKAMEKGDTSFLYMHYSNALAGYLQAHNIKNIGDASPELLNRAREYAIKEAQEATFRDSNALSDWVSSIGRGENTWAPIRVLSEGLMPFRRTPANVLVRAEEYSPLGLVNTLIINHQRKQGKASANDVINSASKALTGSALFAAGILAAAKGIAKAGGSGEDEDLDNFKAMQGQMDYSIKIGDRSYSLSQFAPVTTPFFMGAEVYEAFAESDAVTMDNAIDIFNAIADTITDASFLSSLKDAIEDAASYGSAGNKLTEIALAAAMSYIGQFIPSFLGQIEQATELYRQTTYTDPDNLLGNDLQYRLGKYTSKIPSYDYNQQDYIDAWGRRQSNGNVLERAFNAFVNPTYYSTNRSTEVDAELERLYTENENVANFPNALPQKDSRALEIAKDKRMSPEEYEAYSIESGQKKLQLVTDFMGSSEYKMLNDRQRAEVISNLYQFADDRALKNVQQKNRIAYDGKWDEEALLTDLPSYLAAKKAFSDAKSTTNPNYETADKFIANWGELPEDVRAELKDAGLNVNKLLHAKQNSMDTREFYVLDKYIKDMEKKTGTAAVASALAINQKYGSDSEKLKMLSIANPPTNKDTAKKSSITLRYESAMANGINFDKWTQLESKAKTLAGQADKDNPTKEIVYQAASELGIEKNLAYQIYKKYKGLDEDNMTDPAWAQINPAADNPPVDYYGDGYMGSTGAEMLQNYPRIQNAISAQQMQNYWDGVTSFYR